MNDQERLNKIEDDLREIEVKVKVLEHDQAGMQVVIEKLTAIGEALCGPLPGDSTTTSTDDAKTPGPPPAGYAVPSSSPSPS